MIISPADSVEVRDDGHKYALRPIAAGENVIKYFNFDVVFVKARKVCCKGVTVIALCNICAEAHESRGRCCRRFEEWGEEHSVKEIHCSKRIIN